VTRDTALENEIRATLELNRGATRAPVYYTLTAVETAGGGYLRLVHGHGNYANRILKSVGGAGRLVEESGAAREITLTSSDPSEAPGYLCAFAMGTLPEPASA
jgi:hypothetical protein